MVVGGAGPGISATQCFEQLDDFNRSWSKVRCWVANQHLPLASGALAVRRV